MGFFDLLDEAGNYLNERWDKMWETGKTAWKNDVPNAWHGIWGGIGTMGRAAFGGPDDFSEGLKLWLDSSVGLVGAGIKGSLGVLFEGPYLEKAAQYIDKAYRYGFAYPMSYGLTSLGGAALGEGIKDPFGAEGAWSVNSRRATFGQALVWDIGGLVGGLFPNNSNDRLAWLREHDPRTTEGRSKFDGPESDFLLKYASGTTDLIATVGVDPTVAASAIYKAGRIGRLNVATDAYIARGGHEAEVSTRSYERVRKAALDSESPEQFRERVMPKALFGGQASVLLWAAAQMSESIYRDTYVVLRGMDGLYMPRPDKTLKTGQKDFGYDYRGTRTADGGRRAASWLKPEALPEFTVQPDNLGAWARLVEAAPEIGSQAARLFANWNIGEDALALGVDPGATRAVESLAFNDIQAFVASMKEQTGLWGTMAGRLTGAAMPRTSVWRDLRLGLHEVLTPSKTGGRFRTGLHVKVGRMAQTVMPGTQGWARFIDLEDGTTTSLLHFKALLERSGMPAHMIEDFVSRWAGKGERQGRGRVLENATSAALRLIAERHGLDTGQVEAALPEIGRRQRAGLELIAKGETYITDRAARAGAVNAYKALPNEGKALRDILQSKPTAAAKKGMFGERVHLIPDPDGVVNFMLQDARLLPELAPATDKALLLSQQRKWAPTIDFRALDGQLRWWKWQRGPKLAKERAAAARKKAEDAAREAGEPIQAAGDAAAAEILGGVGSLVGRWTLSKAAKVQSLESRLINGSDFAQMVWKASALLRPAQTPRNLADDLLRRLWVFGKLPMLLGAMRGTERAYQNWFGSDGRIHLWHEEKAEKQARRRANREPAPQIDVEVENLAAKNAALAARIREATAKISEPMEEVRGPHTFPEFAELPSNLGQAWIDGIISWDDFNGAVGAWSNDSYLYRNLGEANSVYEQWQRGNFKYATSEIVQASGEKYTARTIFSGPAPKADKIKQIEQDREFKRLLLRRYFGLKGQGVTFLATPPAKAMDAVLAEATMLDAPKSGKAAPRKPSKAQTAKAQDAEARAAQLRGSYIAQWMDSLIGRHHASRASDNPYAPGEMFINPFDGYEPKLKGDDFEIVRHRNLDRPLNNDKSLNLNAIAAIEHEILDNIDDYLRPDHIMWLSINPLGHIYVGLARARPEVAARTAIKASAGFRIKNFDTEALKDAGTDGVPFTLPNGEVKMFNGAFEGEEGAGFRTRASAQAGAGSSNYLMGENNPGRLMEAEGGFDTVHPGSKGYAPSWERAVNQQLHNDPVAQMFLDGRSESEVIRWIQGTKEGTKYIYRAKHLGTNYVVLIEQIKGFVDEYVPYENSEAGRHLRQAVLEGKATIHDLEAVRPDRAQQPPVHGASLKYTLGNGELFKRISYAVDSAQKMLADMPTDKASRYPFFSESYRRHLAELVKVADLHSGKNGRSPFVDMEFQHRLEHQARERALHDMKYRLYDVTMQTDLARLTRFIVPFSSAFVDAGVKYGRMIKEDPTVVLRGLYYWDTFERNQQIQDENGYVMHRAENGDDEWYSFDPKTGNYIPVPIDKVGTQRYVQFRLPSDLGHLVGKKYFGVDLAPVFAVNKKSFNVFIDLPSTGPMVGIPVNEFSLHHPEFAESNVIKKFVLPFGPSADWGKAAIPGTLRSAWEAYMGEDGSKGESQAKAIFQAELIAFSKGERKTPPSIAEARERAAMMVGLRFSAMPVGPALLSSWVTPVSFQIRSPYQPYIDVYRQMMAQDAAMQATGREPPVGADQRFLEQYGDEFYAVAMTVTRNIGGIRATVESNKTFKEHSALIAAYPKYAGVIVGAEGGTFSKAVYEAQKEQLLRPGSDEHVRKVLTLDESVQELEKRRAWSKYSKMMDQITATMVDRHITTMRGPRARDLVKIRDAFIEDNRKWRDPASGMMVNSPWYEDFTSVNHAEMETRIEAFWNIAQDPTLQKRNDIRGLIDYLYARQEMQKAMAKRRIKSLDSRKAKALLKQWHDTSFQIIEGNTEFAQLWSRWLSNDDELGL